MKRKPSNEGQAVIEFIILLSAAIGIFFIMQVGFQKIRNFLWMDMSCQIIAPCPGCSVDQSEIYSPAQARAPGSCRPNRP